MIMYVGVGRGGGVINGMKAGVCGLCGHLDEPMSCVMPYLQICAFCASFNGVHNPYLMRPEDRNSCGTV